MRVIVAGSRCINATLVVETLVVDAAIASSGLSMDTLICGCALGVDICGWVCARVNEVRLGADRRSPRRNNPRLPASRSGWACLQCDYTQDWAHAFMKDWAWKKQKDAMDDLRASIQVLKGKT